MAIVLATLAGMFAWSFAEYLLHRFYGHQARGRNEFSREHLKHHGKTTYFTPTLRKARVGAVAAAVVTPLAMLSAGAAPGAAFSAGFFGFYVFYELLHRLAHTSELPGPYFRWAKRHHLAHHFTDARKNHGVTSPLWDWVFGTWLGSFKPETRRASSPRAASTGARSAPAAR